MIAIALVATACGSDGAGAGPGPEPDVVVIAVESTGGCAMMGPNCSKLLVFGDGTVEAYRFVGDGDELVDTGSIDPQVVADLARLVSSTDLEAIRARLGPGECRGCYDGIDTTMTFYDDDGPATFASVDVELDAAEPLFAAAWAVADAAHGSIEIPLVAR